MCAPELEMLMGTFRRLSLLSEDRLAAFLAFTRRVHDVAQSRLEDLEALGEVSVPNGCPYSTSSKVLAWRHWERGAGKGKEAITGCMERGHGTFQATPCPRPTVAVRNLARE